MRMSKQTCLIIGASHAGAQLALALRQGGWDGRIVVIGDEAFAPYQRPPLSKDLLTGARSVDQVPIRPAALFAKADVDMRLGTKVQKIDRAAKNVVLANGEKQGYDKLALAVGARPRQVPITGADKEGVFYLRSIADVERIRPFVVAGKRAVIVGGGYIGLEAAASLRGAGMQVTVLEAMPRVLQRVTAEPVSEFFERVHAEEGVRILTNATVASIEGDRGVEHVHCADGSALDADLVIIAVGIVPNTKLARDAGLLVENGIRVDEFSRSSDPDIVAAGDCSFHYNPIYDRWIRLESVQNATDQAKNAAATLCGKAEAYRAVPWFWSDQFDVKLQIAGLSETYDSIVLRGDPGSGRSFAAFYFAGERLLAADAINRPAEFMAAKRLLARGESVDKKRLADDSIPIKTLLEN